MWRLEDVLRELKEEGVLDTETSGKDGAGGLPPGFRFHPTDEELITFYLASKVFNVTTSSTNIFMSSSGVQIAEVDLTRCEPWDLPERAKMGEREWYLYSLRDRKYPSGLRTNRATETGYWKATGKDRQVYASGITTAAGGAGGVLIGMKKTLVFYQGRAPRGVKTRWVMHEYRLEGHFSSFRLSSKEEWVICRIFHKNAEKKLSPQVTHPSHPPPLSPSLPPLSPFFSSLPSLTDPPSTTTACYDTSLQSRYNYANHDILYPLLFNPSPNFSSIPESDTIFPPLNTSTTTIATLGSMSSSTPILYKSFDHPQLLRCLSSSTSTSTSTAANTAVFITKQWHPQQQHWLGKICPQNQYHDNPIDQMMDPQPIPNAYATSTGNNNDNDKDVDAAVAVHVEMSPSFAVAALDRMLNHSINQQHPPESWSFQFHP